MPVHRLLIAATAVAAVTLAACSGPQDRATDAWRGPGRVNLEGRTYSADATPVVVPPELLGDQLDVVRVQRDGVGDGPLQPGEALGFGPGAKALAVGSEAPWFRLAIRDGAAGAVLVTVIDRPGARLGADVVDLNGITEVAVGGNALAPDAATAAITAIAEAPVGPPLAFDRAGPTCTVTLQGAGRIPIALGYWQDAGIVNGRLEVGDQLGPCPTTSGGEGAL